jgi:Na+:H+ antiporter, NhaA family
MSDVSPAHKSPASLLLKFFRLEAAGGILLVLAAVLALICVNSPLAEYYNLFLDLPIGVQIGEFSLRKPWLLWINDGLMAIFFLLVGLEIKREVLEGHLRTRDQVMLPAIAALGGIIAPALIYAYFNRADAVTLHGWAIPAATDIAFALGVMQLLGRRVPVGLKVCLVTLAILDDLAAIIIIALFYTANLSVPMLLGAGVALAVLITLNRRGVNALTPFMLVGLIMWVCVLKSGVHATLAGVALAMTIPLKSTNSQGESPAKWLEHSLHPWVAFGVLPLFAFANAGVPLAGLTLETFTSPITLGIIAGLFIGKQVGVMLFTWLGVTLKLCRLPAETNWRSYYGMALLTGIGFTMSLFIGTLAFESSEYTNAVRLGVLTGSLLSTLCGYTVLRLTCPLPPDDHAHQPTA